MPGHLKGNDPIGGIHFFNFHDYGRKGMDREQKLDWGRSFPNGNKETAIFRFQFRKFFREVVSWKTLAFWRWLNHPTEEYESNWIISPGRGKHEQTYLKPPPSCLLMMGDYSTSMVMVRAFTPNFFSGRISWIFVALMTCKSVAPGPISSIWANYYQIIHLSWMKKYDTLHKTNIAYCFLWK